MQISGLSASNTFSATDVLAIEVNVNGVEKTYKLTGATLATALASIGAYLKTTDVVNNLTSTATTQPLSAAQGKALNDKIAALIAIHPKNADLQEVSLGTSLTSAQAAAISDGTFDGQHLGAYWDIAGSRWRIWGFDWYLNKGDTQCTRHHCVIMPDANLLSADGSTTHYMNDSDTTAGGYAGTKLRSTYVPQMLTTIKNAFGASHVLSHRELLCNAVSNGKASGWSWYDSTVEIPSEGMMYGATIWGNYTDGGSGYNVGTAYPILPLALLKPQHVINRTSFWLRDVVSASWFADVDYNGFANAAGAARALVGVRPFFLLS